MALLSHRGRKRRIRTALVVVAVIVAAEVGAQILAPRLEPVPLDWPNAMTQLQHHQLELLQGTQLDGTNIPVVFVGDSGAQQAFIPDEFAAIDEGNRLSYNASIPGGVPRVTRDWLLGEVIPQLEPDVVVWGIGISDVTEGYGKVQVDAYNGSPGAKDGTFAGLERAAADASALIRLRPVLRDPSLLMGDGRDAVVDDMAAAERLLAPAGQRLGYQPGTDDADAIAVAATLGSFAIDERDVSAITDTITKIRRRGKQVVLVELPTSPQVIESLPNGAEDLSTFRQALADVATETNAQVLRAIGPFTEDDFVDPIHLTEEAAESVTGQVAAALPSLELDDAAATFSQGAGLARTVEQADNQAVRTRLSALSDALDAMDQVCNEPARWMDDALGVIDALDRAAFEIGEGVTDDDTRFRASALARQISSSVGGRVLLQSGCDSGQKVGPSPAVRDFHTRAARLVASYERLDASLAPADDPPTSKLWMHPDQVFHLEGLRADAAAGERPEVLFFGSSESRSGIDPTLFTELTGRTSANLGMNRATPEVAALWISDATAVVRPDQLVWTVSPTDLIATCGLDVRRTLYTTPAEVRGQLFDNLAWKPPGSQFDPIFGPADRNLYDATTTYEQAHAEWVEGSRGLLNTRDGVDEDGLETEMTVYQERVTEGADCGERFTEMTADVRSLVNSGIPVTVVALPAHPDLLALHPGGPGGVLAEFQRAMDDLASAGATYVDLTDGFTVDQFLTVVNMNQTGRLMITERLAEALG